MPTTTPVALSVQLTLRPAPLAPQALPGTSVLWDMGISSGLITAQPLHATLLLSPILVRGLAKAFGATLLLSPTNPIARAVVTWVQEVLRFSEAQLSTRIASFGDVLQLVAGVAVKATSPRDRGQRLLTATVQRRPITVLVQRSAISPVTVGISPVSIVMYTGDTAPTDLFHVVDELGNNVDLTGTTVEFLVRRYGNQTNVWANPLTLCTFLTNPQSLAVPVVCNVDSNGNLVATTLTVRVTGTTGLGVNNVLRMGALTPSEEDVSIASLDSNHITGVFNRNHSTGDTFDQLPLAVIPTIAAAVTLGGAPQSVLISSSTALAATNSVRIGAGTVNDETVTLTAIADSTHMTAIFTKNHAIGEQIIFPALMTDPTYNAKNGYTSFKWPSSGLVAAATYIGQLKITFPDSTIQHSDYVTISVEPGL